MEKSQVTVRLNIIDRDGNAQKVEAEPGLTLMNVLRDAALGVEGTCGGECSCGSCHVYLGDTMLRHAQDAG